MRQHLASKHGGAINAPSEECRWLHHLRRHAAICRQAVAQDLTAHQALASQVSMHSRLQSSKLTEIEEYHWRRPQLLPLTLQQTCSASMDRFKPAAIGQCQVMCCRAGCTYLQRGVCYKSGGTSPSRFCIPAKAACEQRCTAKAGACTASLLPSSKYSSNACCAAHN